jgi:DinB superfamily
MTALTVAVPRSMTTMQPFFREMVVNRETADALLTGLSASQLVWRAAPDKWSLADICSHLARLTELYLPALDDAIERGHHEAAFSERPFQGGSISRLLVWSMEPPVRLRMSAPRTLQPRAGADAESERRRYRASQHAFELRLERAAGLDLAHVSVKSPTIRFVSLALGTTLAVLLAHERRHLWQATVVRQSADFPAHHAD